MRPAGIGFAKTDAGNVELMAGLAQLRARLGGVLARLPLLVGPSRKGFLGRLTGAPSATGGSGSLFDVPEPHTLVERRSPRDVRPLITADVIGTSSRLVHEQPRRFDVGSVSSAEGRERPLMY